MTAAPGSAPRSRTAPRLTPAARRVATAVVVVIVLIAMFFGTRIVPKDSTLVVGKAAFSQSAYGKKQFPVVQRFVTAHAVDAATLATAVDRDVTAAGKRYGVSSDDGATVEVPVKLTGKVGKVPAAGYTPITVTGLPAGHMVAVQLGPAVNGTDLRDATGKVQLGQFENQIQYEDAATGINDRLKTVLAKAGAPDLTGRTVTVEGVFQLINPKQWNVTPATIAVQG